MRRWLGICLLVVGWLALGLAYLRWLGPLTSPLVWEQGGRHYQLLEPRALGFALLVPAFLLVLYRSLAYLPWQQRLLSTLFRSAFVLLLALCVGRLVRSVESSRVCTVFLVDVSDSISDAALQSATQTLEKARAARRQDAVTTLCAEDEAALVKLREDQYRLGALHVAGQLAELDRGDQLVEGDARLVDHFLLLGQRQGGAGANEGASAPGAYLIPMYDEMGIGYKDLRMVLAEPPPGDRILSRPIVIDGRAVGSWKRTVAKRAVRVEATLFTELSAGERAALEAAVERFGRFIELPASLELTP